MTRCLIPAAGRGTRLRPVTRAVPKELLPVGTRPILQWCLTEALEAGFDEIGVVVSGAKPALEAYVADGLWRDGILPAVADRAAGTEIAVLRQERPRGVVDAVLSAEAWVADGDPFAVYLPDNVRIAGPALLTADDVAEAGRRDATFAACHKVGPETRHYFGNVGRVELDPLAPAGEPPAVLEVQERGEGVFQAPPEGAWRIAPRYAVTGAWLEVAREVAGAASLSGEEADDVAVYRRLAETGRLFAVPWEGTLVDAGHPVGYLYAQHLIHEAGQRERDLLDETGRSGSGLLEIEI